MNLTLTRLSFLASGIFGELDADDESFTLYSLEHSYSLPDGIEGFYAKIKPGTYTCKRGMHQLEGMAEPFETFQVVDVPGHSNILFHTGNTNKDSSGCILVGLFRSGDTSIMQSRAAFNLLMKAQEGIDEFTLTVI